MTCHNLLLLKILTQLYTSLSDSVNELLKIKDELTKERDEKLSEIAKVRNQYFPYLEFNLFTFIFFLSYSAFFFSL